MFQELLVADLVVADLTLDNPNVWYELGVRHALRARGVVLVQGPRPTQPVRHLHRPQAALRAEGRRARPGDAGEQDRARLAAMARETLDACARAQGEPGLRAARRTCSEPAVARPAAGRAQRVQRRLRGVAQPAWRWRGRRTAPATSWCWPTRRRRGRWRLEAQRAGRQLPAARLQQFDFALEQFEAALAIDPDDLASRAAARGRASAASGASRRRASASRQLTDDYPADAEAWALAGRVEQGRLDRALAAAGAAQPRRCAAAAAAEEALPGARRSSPTARPSSPTRRTSTRASTRSRCTVLRAHLGGDQRRRPLTDDLLGGVRWAVAGALRARRRQDYWARATLGRAEPAVLRARRRWCATGARRWPRPTRRLVRARLLAPDADAAARPGVPARAETARRARRSSRPRSRAPQPRRS
ncbi:MAG: hypothetical protein MZW92_66230 [Comamonadaceae bacterium]|nr:hypothetical protein [Comamonadaceae bacterium]